MVKEFHMTGMRIPEPISGGLLLSYQCSAECRHCMYACSPKWEGDWIAQKDLEECVTLLSGKIRPSPRGGRAVSLNYGLHFTGGEPFLNFELLMQGASIAGELDIPSSFVETNCFWCHSDEATREKLELLKEAGLRGILISVNPFYAEFVPFQRTERCIRISKEVFGANVMVYQPEYYSFFRRLGIKEKMSLDHFRKLTRDARAPRVELFLMGRAASQLKDFYPSYPSDRFFYEPCSPPFLRGWHNHFDNYGNFMPGYCGGISLGDWRNLNQLIEEGIDLERHPVLTFLITENMKGLFHFAKDFGYQEPPEGYLSKCDLCLDLRMHLVSERDFLELKPIQFYEHVRL